MEPLPNGTASKWKRFQKLLKRIFSISWGVLPRPGRFLKSARSLPWIIEKIQKKEKKWLGKLF
jgi:hypothetical protein